jgi:hypothetical protein
MIRRVAPLLLAALLAVGQMSAVRAVEAGAAEIPGVLWSGSRATGSVGGAVFDQVWRLVLTEPRVALVRLQGAVGAELGLYLFDATAASVLTATPIEQSAQPGGTQRFSAALPAGTYYLDVNGRNPDRAYAFDLTVALIQDPTPPFLTVSIAGGAAKTNSLNPTVSIAGIDSLSGVEAMRLRVDAGEWGAWIPWSKNTTVQFAATEGTHRVEAQVKNGADLISTTERDEIELDLTAPVGTLLSPSLFAVVSGARPTIRYQLSESLQRASWNSTALTVQDANGAFIRGVASYNPATRIGSYTVSSPLVAGVEYVVTQGGARDPAGNLAVIEPWVLSYQVKPKVSFIQASVTAIGERAARLAFNTTRLPVGSTLLLERRTLTASGVTWESAGQVTSTGAALQFVNVRPTASGAYALRFVGSATHQPALSPVINVVLAPQIVALGTSAIRTVAPGSAQTVSVQVLPAEVRDLTMVRYRCNATFNACTVVERIPVTPNADGIASVSWAPTKGNWVWRAKTATTSAHRKASSTAIRFTVR